MKYYLTQNIDSLEKKTGLKKDEIVQVHGAMDGAVCAKCKKVVDHDTFMKHINMKKVLYCECGGPIKESAVFFGEDPDKKLYELLHTIQNHCDLLIVMGTSLMVYPFRNLVGKVGSTP